MNKITILFFVAALLCLTGCLENSSMDIPAVTSFDAAKYMGKWYEYARLPNRFEKNMTNVYTIYTMRKNGNIDVLNCGVKGDKTVTISGIAKFAGDKSTGELKVSFFRPFYSRYRIIKLAPDYRFAVVTGSSKNYLWVLSRSKHLSQTEKDEIISFLKHNNFPVANLIYPQ